MPYENQAIDKKKVSSTPYDDVFKTLLNDCSSLIIPVINEVFHEHYRGDETITFHKDLHYMNGQDGEGEKRVTDNYQSKVLFVKLLNIKAIIQLNCNK